MAAGLSHVSLHMEYAGTVGQADLLSKSALNENKNKEGDDLPSNERVHDGLCTYLSQIPGGLQLYILLLRYYHARYSKTTGVCWTELGLEPGRERAWSARLTHD
jgi:hypothetical protein